MISPVGTAPAAGGLKELREAAQSLESVFVQMLLSSMRQTVQKSGLLDGGKGEEVFTGLLDRHLAESASRRDGGIGLARVIVDRYAKYVDGGDATGGNVDVLAGEEAR